MKDDEVKIRVTIDGKEAEKELKEISKQVENFANKTESTLGIGGVAIGSALGLGIFTAFSKSLSLGIDAAKSFVSTVQDVLSTSITSAAALQDTALSFEVMLGSAEKAKALLQSLSDFSKITPFNLTDLQEQSKRLLAFGFSMEEIIPTMEILGNIASGVGRENLPFLIKALGDVKARTFLTGQEINQFVNANVGLKDLLAQLYKISLPEVTQRIEDQAVSYEDVYRALQLATGEGGKFNNLMERQSRTLNGTISNLEDARDSIFRLIGGITDSGEIIEGGFLDVISEKAQQLLNFVNAHKEEINNFLIQLSTMIGTGIKDVFQWVIDHGPEIERIIREGIIPALKGIFEWAKVEGPKFIDWLKEAWQWTKELYRQLSEIVSILIQVYEKLKPVINALSKLTSPGLIGEIGKLSNKIFGIGDSASDSGSDVDWLIGKLNVLENRASVMNMARGAAISAIGALRGFENGGIVQKFAEGGVVRGNSFSGDRVLVRANSGEMILNRQQQAALFAKLSNSGPTNNFNAPISFGGSISPAQQMNIFQQLLTNL